MGLGVDARRERSGLGVGIEMEILHCRISRAGLGNPLDLDDARQAEFFLGLVNYFGFDFRR